MQSGHLSNQDAGFYSNELTGKCGSTISLTRDPTVPDVPIWIPGMQRGVSNYALKMNRGLPAEIRNKTKYPFFKNWRRERRNAFSCWQIGRSARDSLSSLRDKLGGLGGASRNPETIQDV